MTRPKNATLKQLNDYADHLEQRTAQLQKQNETLLNNKRLLEDYIQRLREQVLLGRRNRFGRSSEQTQSDQLLDQVSMLETMAHAFNEAEAIVDQEEDKNEGEAGNEDDPGTVKISYERRKRRVSFREKLEQMPPSRTVKHELPKDEQICVHCHEELHVMKTERRLELHVVPAQVEVVEHLRDVYACRHCERNDTTVPVVAAPMPKAPIKGSGASASALAHIIMEKYVKAVPLYRQEQQFARDGVELSRQTMANWVVAGSEQRLLPLYERINESLLTQDIIHVDETHVQVLGELNRKAQTKSTMWVKTSGRDGPPAVVFDYRQTRGVNDAKNTLHGFSGFAHVDGYAVYERVLGITLVGCWAHARRKFDQALTALPASARSKGPVAAEEGLAFCNKLFSIERRLKGLAPEQRKLQREQLSAPVLKSFKTWLELHKHKALPKTALGTAVSYCLNQWPKLVAFLQDGRLEIDNNRAERAIRPFVVGRKNWLFSNTPRGARASAVVYSIVETAKANDLKPFDYLKFLFERLPNIDTDDPAALDTLLPWSDLIPDTCRNRPRPR